MGNSTTKWRTFGIAALTLASLTLTACGANQDTTGTAPASATAAGSSEEVVLEVWDYLGQGASHTAMESAVAAFEEANPGITVKRTSFAYGDLAKAIVQGGVGGSVPDVAIVDVVDTQNFASLGLLQDVTEQVGGLASDFYEGPWSSTQVGGKTYGLPLNSNNLALYYNKDMFDGAGLEAPTTWDELRSTAKALSSADTAGIAMSGVKNEQGTFQFLPFLWQTGGDLDSFDTDGATALQFLKDLVDDGSMSSSVANYSQEDARTQFVNGKAAMMINGPWELQNLKEAGINYGVAPLAAGEEPATGLGGENVVTFAQAAQPEAAVQFLEYLTSTEGAQIYCDESGQLSSRVDLEGKLALSSDPDMQVFEAQMASAHARAYGAKYNEISAAVQESLQKVLTGAASPADAASEAAQTITPLLP
ncbi:sugar ABC transporter substrate-binding protein [Tessaracoccus lapidicaptus]|uniref:Sugar ABC transporter substrate-binding protein n=1 Tax=Tessaracoccus lapidicaptus TaxID=1427523 RepID=A0A1C0AGS6_9ACTN|nr:sugar ABC transporter substrate-binding protein [Tessaracoccus lapidicaptus]OCL30864.1 sugar ABC transporter substrate-binding protein [Tessaracoccus lapidicaptus]